MGSRADLHIHSKYSNRPQAWILRRFNVPESFVEPVDLYRRCKERGMDFVTITDHDTIAGVAEIADRDDVFVSAQIAAKFPENGAHVHLLLLGIDESEFKEIHRRRDNIFDVQEYCFEQDVIHVVAHALDRVDDQLTVEQFEKLILLFQRFETIDGAYNARSGAIVRTILENLTPEIVSRLAEKHGIEPVGPEPWKKCFTGGSHDYSGVHAACAFTATPDARNVDEYLALLRRGDHAPEGESGSSLRTAHRWYRLAFEFYKSRFMGGANVRAELFGEMFRRMLEPPVGQSGPSLRDTAFSFMTWLATSYHKTNLNATEGLLVDECSRLFAEHQALGYAGRNESQEQRLFGLACRVSDEIGGRFFREFLKRVKEGNFLDAAQTFCALGPVSMSLAPYVAAIQTQHKDEPYLQAVAGAFPASRGMRLRSDKRVWATDTFADLNGVSRTIRTIAGVAQNEGKSLTVACCLESPPAVSFPLKNFAPTAMFPLPEYESQIVTFPPVLEMIEYIERNQFSELVISTPGPVGLAALAAGKLLGLRLTGIYHTDFPEYVATLTDDAGLAWCTRKFMLWFYSEMHVVLAPSDAYKNSLIRLGLEPHKVGVMRRGVDRKLFHPKWRDEEFYSRRGLPPGLTYLYVGRISQEKGIERLLRAFATLDQRERPTNLAVVGDGPQLDELKAKYASDRVAFLGRLDGDELSRSYASADVFVFPSETDTFGNAVLEAQAAGLPAIVSLQGGPPEIIGRKDSGLAVNMARIDELAAALARFRDDAPFREELGRRALENAAECTWERAFYALWNAHEASDAALEGRSADSAVCSTDGNVVST